MFAICSSQGCDSKMSAAIRPFHMIKRVAFWRRNHLYKIAWTICNQNLFMRGIFFPRKFISCFTTKVKEQSLFSRIRKRYIAGLFAIIPNLIFPLYIRPQQLRPRNGKISIGTNPAIERPIKNFSWSSKFSIWKGYAPCRRFLPSSLVRIILRTCHINDFSIRIDNSPSRNRGTFHIQLNFRRIFGI